MKINYDSVRRDAKKLRSLADECEKAAEICRRYQGQLATAQYWQGSAADAYANGLGQLNKKNTALAREVEQLASLITRVANEMEEEDRALAAKISSRTAGVARSAATTAGKTASSAVSSAADVIRNVTTTVQKTNTSTVASAAASLLSKLFGKG